MPKVRERNQGIAEQNMVLLSGAGIYAPKALKEAPPFLEEWGWGRTSIIHVNFCCPLSWFRFYSPAQTLGSLQINMSLTRV